MKILKIILQIILLAALGLGTIRLLDSALFIDHPVLIWLSPALAGVMALLFGWREKTARVIWLGVAFLLFSVGNIAKPFADVGREGKMAGNLSMLRMEIEKTKKENVAYPTDVTTLSSDPETFTLRLYPDHPKTNTVLTVEDSTAALKLPMDSGTWLYMHKEGSLRINCTHYKRHAGSRPWREL